MEPEVTYDYDEPEPHLGWNYHITWGNGSSTSSFGYATIEEAEVDARETLALYYASAGEEGGGGDGS